MTESRATIHEVLDQTVLRHGDLPAMRAKHGGEWRTTTWRQYREQAHLAGRGFLRLGLSRGQGVVILGFNRPEWFLSDVGAIAAGGVPAGIYTTSSADQCRYIARHAEAAVAVVENREYLATFLEIWDDLPDLQAVVLMEGEPDPRQTQRVVSWARLLELGREVRQEELDRRIAAQRPDDLATLIYTSGTTGPPKGVMLSHHNVTWVTRRVRYENGDEAQYLDLAFRCRYLGGDPRPVDGEASEVAWFPLEGMPPMGDEMAARVRYALAEEGPAYFSREPLSWNG